MIIFEHKNIAIIIITCVLHINHIATTLSIENSIDIIAESQCFDQSVRDYNTFCESHGFVEPVE